MGVGICCNCNKEVLFDESPFFGEDGDRVIGLFCPLCYEINDCWYCKDEED